MSRLRLYVITRPIFQRELELLVAGAKSIVTFRHFDVSLRECSAGNVRVALQGAMDDAPPGRRDAIAKSVEHVSLNEDESFQDIYAGEMGFPKSAYIFLLTVLMVIFGLDSAWVQ